MMYMDEEIPYNKKEDIGFAMSMFTSIFDGTPIIISVFYISHSFLRQ